MTDDEVPGCFVCSWFGCLFAHAHDAIDFILRQDGSYIGYYAYEWEPSTQRRKSVQVSQGLAGFLSMHPEEVMARVGHSDHYLPNSEIEFLGAILSA
eukprot:763046-Hanusia_phi.AAC.3